MKGNNIVPSEEKVPMKGRLSCKQQVLETHDALIAFGNFSTHKIRTKMLRVINNNDNI